MDHIFTFKIVKGYFPLPPRFNSARTVGLPTTLTIKSTFSLFQPDVVSNGHHSVSPRSTTSDLDVHKQCFVALFDYNPYQSCTTGRPDLEFPFKKGDIMTVYGDVDANGYYNAEMEGMTCCICFNGEVTVFNISCSFSIKLIS